jgi:hypothetical protein
MTFSAPSSEKWRQYASEIVPRLPDLELLARKLGQLGEDGIVHPVG